MHIASFLSLGFDINSPFKSITLSAPNTKTFGFLRLTLFAFNSAKFFDIISGETLLFNKLLLIRSSSTDDGST